MQTKPGYHTLTPYISIRGAARAIEFYKQAFNATELMRDADPDGTIRHAEIQIGDSPIMITDDAPQFEFMRTLQDFGGSAVHMFLYVEDADALASRALNAGAKVIMEMDDKPYGRTGGVRDPFGLIWWITTPPEIRDRPASN
jgi:PhnB protein